MDYVLHILVLVAIYVMLSSSLNLIAGYAGILSLAHAAFFGIGAYTAALFAVHTSFPPWLAALCAIAVAGVSSVLVGLPSLRIRDDYFVLTTFGFQVIVYSLLNNLDSVTGGPMGVTGIPVLRLLGMPIASPSAFCVVAWTFCLVCLAVQWLIVKSPYGRALRALREDEVFVASAGKSSTQLKVRVFAVGGCIAAVAGVIYAHYVRFIDPSSFTVMESILIISFMIIGGPGSFWGPVVGTVILLTVPEVMRFTGLPSSVAANARQMLYGGLLVAFMMWRPRGLLGEHVFGQRGGD